MKASKELLTEVAVLLESLADICDSAPLLEDQIEVLRDEELIERAEEATRQLWSIINEH